MRKNARGSRKPGRPLSFRLDRYIVSRGRGRKERVREKARLDAILGLLQGGGSDAVDVLGRSSGSDTGISKKNGMTGNR